MRAIFWKEFRESLKWAVLAMLALALVLAYLLYSMSRPFNWGNAAFSAESIQMITVIGTALTAASLGILQTLPERRRDQWAFLMHRPAAPTEIFFGKVIPGLLLYVAAMLVPLFIAAWWSSRPGHLAAPFSWRMLLPGIADIIGGVAFYFAGVLTAARDARWFGTRAAPFGLAVFAEALILGMPEFWLAILFAVPCIVVLAVAAWGSFVASGQYGPQPKVTRAALGVTLLTAILGIGFIVVVCIEAIVAAPPPDLVRYGVSKDGKVLRLNVSGYGMVVHGATDLDGNPIDVPRNVSFWDLMRSTLLQFYTIRQNPQYLYHPGYRASQRFVLMIDNDGPYNWYYAPFARLVLGYDREARRCIGTIGPSGFSPPGAVVTQLFPDEDVLNDNWLVLAFPSAVYRLDLGARQARLLATGTARDPVVGAAVVRTKSEWPPAGPTAVVTLSRITLFDKAKPLISVPYEFSPEKYSSVDAAVLPAGGYMFWYQPSYLYFTPLHMRQQIVKVSTDGQQLAHYDLPPIINAEPLFWPHALWALVTPLVGPPALFGCALIGTYLWAGYLPAAVLIRDAWLELLGQNMRFWGLAGVLLLVGAVFWAVLMHRIARRYAFTKRQTFWWTIAAFLLGPSALLTLWSLRDWPTRVPCASCHEKRVVDRDRCEHCGAPWPAPPATGIEIFDQPAVAMQQ